MLQRCRVTLTGTFIAAAAAFAALPRRESVGCVEHLTLTAYAGDIRCLCPYCFRSLTSSASAALVLWRPGLRPAESSSLAAAFDVRSLRARGAGKQRSPVMPFEDVQFAPHAISVIDDESARLQSGRVGLSRIW